MNEGIENNYPFEYATRIKRFHRPIEGLDYFNPFYTNINDPNNDFGIVLNIYNTTPFEFSKFEDWNRLISSYAVWRYYNDSNYRKRVEMWNRIYNPFWAFDASPFNPYGSFNFAAGFGLAGNFSSASVHCTALSGFYYGYSIGDNNGPLPFGPNGYFTTLATGAPNFNQKNNNRKRVVSNTTELKFNQPNSIVKTSPTKVNFKQHLTPTTKKKLPKNWRTMPGRNKPSSSSLNVYQPEPIFSNINTGEVNTVNRRTTSKSNNSYKPNKLNSFYKKCVLLA